MDNKILIENYKRLIENQDKHILDLKDRRDNLPGDCLLIVRESFNNMIKDAYQVKDILKDKLNRWRYLNE